MLLLLLIYLMLSLWQAKSHELFYIWLTKLCAHRVFKKNEALSVHRGVLHALSLGQGNLPSMASLAHRNAVSTSTGLKLH